MSRKLLHFALLQLIILSVGLTVWVQSPKSDFFNQHYLFGLWDIRAALADNDAGDRIVLLGGSSIGFSVSAEELTRNLGVRVINTGIHAAIGYENIWYLIEDLLDPARDTVVVSPEYDMIPLGNAYSTEFCVVVFLSQEPQRLAAAPECVVYVASNALMDVIYWAYGKNSHHLDTRARRRIA